MLLRFFFYVSQPVGCDGVVGSGVTMDACGVCGGQGKGCRLYEGIFMEPILPRGHQPVTSIPKGAMSLNISELRHSSNFLGIVMEKKRKSMLEPRLFKGYQTDRLFFPSAFLTNNLMC